MPTVNVILIYPFVGITVLITYELDIDDCIDDWLIHLWFLHKSNLCIFG